LWTTEKLSGVTKRQVGYFAQDHKALIEPGIKVLEWLHQWDPAASTEEIRGLLGQMLFPRDDAEKRPDVLSGGEAGAADLLQADAAKPNLLVSTSRNHLDLESITPSIFRCSASGNGAAVTHDEI